MDKQKKSLLCMYVDDFCGINKESFNFNIERRYTIKESKISRKSDEEIEDFPKDFWGDNVSAVTLLIGENGAGKTTLIRLLIKWFCQLSAGHIPQEKGALVISVGDEEKDRLIAFDDGKPWEIEIKNEKIVCIEKKDEIKKLLGDIRLAYYTDTMTDLELSDTLTAKELEFLWDESLLTRLSNSIKDGYTVESIKDCIKREDFKRQMELFLYSKENPNNMPEFPIRYMKFTAIKAGDKESFDDILDGNDTLVGETIDLWNKVFASDANHNLPAITRALLWGVFSGTIRSLLQWERTLPNLKKRIVTEQVKSSLREYIRTNYDWKKVFSNFFENLFSDCKREFLDVQRGKEFYDKWEKQQVEDKIKSFLKTLKELEKGKFLKKWKPFENTQNIWEFKLEYFDGKNKNNRTVLKEWKSLWECYLAVAHLMPKCKFDWKYASSGGKNRNNLYVNLFNIVKECKGKEINQLWVLLDEPDNTFHPDWERRIIQSLLEICSNFEPNFQLLISTHSPIMLSDVPKQAAILLKTDQKRENNDTKEKKQQENPKSNSFGQQIYTLFNDAFFMKQGIIGAFADKKIEDVYKGLYEIEEQISKRNEEKDTDELDSSEERKIRDKNELEDYERAIEKYKRIINLIDEPLLHGHLSQSYKLCNRKIKELRNDLRKEGIINDKNETV